MRTENGGLKPPFIEQTMSAAKLVNQLLVELLGFRDGRVNAAWHLALGQQFVKLPCLIGGTAKMSHRFRPHGALRGSNKLDVILHGPLQYKAHRLAVFRRQFGEFDIKLLVNFRTDFYRGGLGHGASRFRTTKILSLISSSVKINLDCSREGKKPSKQRCPEPTKRSNKSERVADAENLAGFTGGNPRVGGHAVVVVEAGLRGPAWDVRAAVIAEDFLEGGNDLSRAWIARRNRATRAGIAALEIHFADAEADWVLGDR